MTSASARQSIERATASIAVDEYLAPARQLVLCKTFLRASEVNAAIDATGDPPADINLYVFADSLSLDAPLRPVGGAVVIARVLDVGGATTPQAVASAPAGSMTVLQVLTDHVDSGELSYRIGNETWKPALATDRANLITIVDGLGAQRDVSQDLDDIIELTWHPVLISYLSCAYVSGASLLNSRDTGDHRAARDILQWASFLSNLACSDASHASRDLLETDRQLRSMLILSAGSSEDARPAVPGLSLDFYLGRVKDLVNIISAYEDKIAQLETQKDIAAAVGTISSDMAADVNNDLQALRDTADVLTQDVLLLSKQSDRLAFDFMLRGYAVRREAIRFKLGAEVAAFWEFCKAVVALVEAVISIGATASEPISKGKQVFKNAAFDTERQQKAFKGDGTDFFNEAFMGSLDKASAMSRSSKAMTAATEALLAKEGAIAKLAKAVAQLGGTLPTLASTFGKSGVLDDPSISKTIIEATLEAQDGERSWDAFVREVELTLQSSVDKGIDGAREYLLAVSSLAEFGKAQMANSVAMAGKLAQLHDIQRQIESAESTAEQFQASKQKASSAEQQKALLQAQLARRMSDVKRMLLLSAQRYRAAWTYRNLAPPSLSIDYAMNSTELQAAMPRASGKQGSFLLSGATEADSVLETVLPIVEVSSKKFDEITGNEAFFGPVMAKQEEGLTRLSWAIDPSSPPADWPVKSSPTALFIRNASFILENVAGLATSVSLSVTASGMVKNIAWGGDARPPMAFAIPALTLDCDYRIGHEDTPDTPWARAPGTAASYVMHTPFCQWTAVLAGTPAFGPTSCLRVRLNVTQRKLT